MQDLRCQRTNQVHERRLCNHSSYGGGLALSKPGGGLRDVIGDFKSVADFYGLALLSEQLSWLAT